MYTLRIQGELESIRVMYMLVPYWAQAFFISALGATYLLNSLE